MQRCVHALRHGVKSCETITVTYPAHHRPPVSDQAAHAAIDPTSREEAAVAHLAERAKFEDNVCEHACPDVCRDTCWRWACRRLYILSSPTLERVRPSCTSQDK